MDKNQAIKKFGLVYGTPILSGIFGTIAGFSYSTGNKVEPSNLERMLIIGGPVMTSAAFGYNTPHHKFDSAVGGGLLGTFAMGAGYGLGYMLGKYLS